MVEPTVFTECPTEICPQLGSKGTKSTLCSSMKNWDFNISKLWDSLSPQSLVTCTLYAPLGKLLNTLLDCGPRLTGPWISYVLALPDSIFTAIFPSSIWHSSSAIISKFIG